MGTGEKGTEVGQKEKGKIPEKFLNTKLLKATDPVSGVLVFCQYWSTSRPYNEALDRKFSKVTLVTKPEPPG